MTSACTVATVYEPQADREGIRNVVRSHLKDFEPCYRSAIENRPGARGKMTVVWQVNDAGVPGDVSIKEVDPSLTGASDCVMERIRKMRFPKPPEGEEVIVTYPFYFSENGQFGPESANSK